MGYLQVIHINHLFVVPLQAEVLFLFSSARADVAAPANGFTEDNHNQEQDSPGSVEDAWRDSHCLPMQR
ncbi:hypothetical protein NC653_009444 [Populus alba x Populus x berolinensis]|uniref:Uncharacterized protein n=1 Tax=Populus alba x Populus x berolinensis TaxID=444605 RepID=A0AAD6R9E5_9ROSI|nr:hypothetical protein NC653_009444 [Populus alba x Populus x berolinensis]